MNINELLGTVKKLSYVDLLRLRNVVNAEISSQQDMIRKLDSVNSKIKVEPIVKEDSNLSDVEEGKKPFVPSEFVCSQCNNKGISFDYEGFDCIDEEETFKMYKCDNNSCNKKYRLNIDRFTDCCDMPTEVY